MSAAFKAVTLLLAILGSCPESETANITAFISNSSSPSYVVEGQNLTLVWTYTVDGTLGFSQFTVVPRSEPEKLIGKKYGPGVITVQPEYQSRFRAQATNTRAELNILAVLRSDETTYRVNFNPTGVGFLVQAVVVIVNFSSVITGTSKNQTVTEGGNATLKCLAEGKPTPNITWRRLSDKTVVTMPLTDIRRQDAGKYRCTAYNGIGSPTEEDVFIDVQCEYSNLCARTLS